MEKRRQKNMVKNRKKNIGGKKTDHRQMNSRGVYQHE